MTKVKTRPVDIKAAGAQDGTGDGVFEAVVATYDLDSYRDKILPGAFEETLAEWKASGDPIPVLWSHNSHDPDCHIGYVVEAEEREGVGLWVKAQLDLDAAKAAQVYRLLKGRRVRQFSFAFDVIEGGWVEQIVDGKDESYFELRKLKLWEVGPCLVGVNQETELLDVKADQSPAVVLSFGAPGTGFELRLPDPHQNSGSARPAKAGRVLSAKNETTLRDALGALKGAGDSIKAVLDSIEPVDDDATKAKPTVPAPASAADAAKAAGEPAGGPAVPLRHIPGLDRGLVEAETAALMTT